MNTQSTNQTFSETDSGEQMQKADDAVSSSKTRTGDDAVSITSTVKSTQNPSTAFDNLMVVRNMIDELWPGHDPADFKIEYLNCGRNHNVGITMFEYQRKILSLPLKLMKHVLAKCIEPRGERRRIAARYILRIPRSDANSMSLVYQVSTLAYVKRHISVDIPAVITHDPGCENALTQPYMLQKRLSGTPLMELWATLNLRQKKSYVHWLAKFMLDLNDLQSSCAGVVSPTNTVGNLRHPKIEQMPIPRPLIMMTEEHQAQTAPSKPQTTRKFLLSLCNRQHDWAKETSVPHHSKIWDGFIYMIDRLYGLGFLPDDEHFHFYHGNLQPRNIMAEIVDDASVHIIGILDWDLAVFAPKFMSTRPPFCLWNEDATSESEEDAMCEPEGSDKAVLKQTYESVIGT